MEQIMSSQLLQSSQVAEIYAGSSDLRLAEKGNKQFSLERVTKQLNSLKMKTIIQ